MLQRAGMMRVAVVLVIQLGYVTGVPPSKPYTCRGLNTNQACVPSEPQEYNNVAPAPTICIYNLTESNGTIEVNKDPTKNYQYPYCTNSETLWTIRNEEANNPKVTLTLQYTDLGSPYSNIHDSKLTNYTEGDFVLVGAGEDILGGNELMFFGQRKEKQKVVVPGGVAHVFLYSTNSTFNATGFTITYNITEEVTTPAPITTTPTPILPDAFVPINGIPTTKWKDYNSSFTQAIAGMSTDYVHNVLGYVNQPNITSTMVLIQDIKSCNPFRCQKDCVAYDFSIDSDLFTKYTLDQMLNTESLHHYITQVNEGSQICEEHPTISLTRYVAVPVFILIFGIVISALFWKYSEKGSLTEKRLKYETEQQDRWDDQRRRSSANASILGLGRPASFASRGSRSSIPFPKSKGAQDYDSDDNVGFDMSDFREYDPDMGTVDPTQFGLDKG